MVDIGKRILHIRTQILKIKSQTTFGELVGGSKTTTVSGWERGISDPGAQLLKKMAEMGGVSLDWLLTGKEHQPSFIDSQHLPKSGAGEIISTIAPGNNKAAARIKDQSNRPTVKIPHLKWIVEWMDSYFANNEEQALLFYEQLKDLNPSFVSFIENEKKPTSNDNQNRSLENVSDGTQG